MRRGGGEPVVKKLRRTIESPTSNRGRSTTAAESDNESMVWHSTAVSHFSERGSPGPFHDAGSEILGSQKSAFSDSGIERQSTHRPLNRSPVKITETSGHVYFSSILQKHGFFLSPEGNHTQNDSMVFRKILTEWAEKMSKGTEGERQDFQMFIQDMKRYLGLKENLINAMSPTEHAQELYQASLLHSLLGVLPLQKHLFSVLFPTLAEAAYTAREDEDVAFFSLLLNQLKWLPYLNEAEKITDDLLEVFERATEKAQHELMKLLPDIVPESQHRKIGDVLQKLLEDFSPLCSSIMDCFSVINVPDSYIVKVRVTAVENMLVADQKDIPAYLGFLLGVEDAVLLSTIIGDLRDKLAFKPPVEVNEEYKESMIGMIEKVKFSMSVNAQLVPAWIKQVKDEIQADIAEFKTLDFIMLFIFVTSDKVAEIPLKTLFLNEERTLQVLDDVLECLPTVVDHNSVFEGILKFCEKFFWTNATKFYIVASKVLAKLFPIVTDVHGREIIKLFTCTLTHGNKMCREHVLNAMKEIARKDSAKLLRFTNLIMAIMDFVLDFEPSQIRSVIRILATVAYIPGNRESERFETEFCILLRKQLSQRNEKIKSVGVIGAVAAIDQLSKRQNAGAKLQELIELVWNIVESDGYSSWIFFDEMSDVVNERDLPESVQSFLKTTIGEKFKERWTVDESSSSSRKTGDHGLKIKPVLNANETMTEVDCLCIGFDSIPRGLWPSALAAHTKFLCALENKISNGDLQEIDLIVGCPLMLPDFDYYTGLWLSSLTVEKKNALGRYLLVAINFTRELISAFYQQRDPASRIKVFLRLDHLIMLQKMLITFVNSWDNSCPSLPFAYALDKNPGALSFVQASRKKGKAKEKKSTKNVPPTPAFEDSSDSDTGSVVSKASIPRKAAARPTASAELKDFVEEIQPAGIRPFVRNLHASVFRLLKYPLNVNPPNIDHVALLEGLSAEQPSYRNELKQVSILSPETLVLLLRDLNQQLESDKNDSSLNIHKICDGFSKDIFKSLCEHLDVLQTSCVAEFTSWSLSKKRQVESCFRLVYSTMRSYLETENKPPNNEKFINALKVIAEHAGGPASQVSTEESVAQYLRGYPDFINSPLTAAEQLKVMKVVYDAVDDKREIAKKIDETCKEYLSRRWKIPSSVIPIILNIWFTSTESPIDVILSLTKAIIPEDPEKAIPDSAEYKACTAINFQTWYRAIMEALCQHVSKKMRKNEDVQVACVEWNDCIEVFKLLVSVIQQKRLPKIITPLLRNVRYFLEAFSNHGIKLLPSLWKADANQARTFLRQLQNPTRKIQYICEHCKLEKYTLLIRYVPGVKRALETLIFKVREVLTLHGAPNAFWMGSLKHRNLDGEEINSQINDLSDSELEEDSNDEETSANNENLFDMPSDEPSDQED